MSPVKPAFAIAEPRWSVRYPIEWIHGTCVGTGIRRRELWNWNRDRLWRKGHRTDSHLCFESRPMLRSKTVHPELGGGGPGIDPGIQRLIALSGLLPFGLR